MNGASSGQTVRIMFESSPIGMCAVMTDGTVLRANDAFRALLGERRCVLDVAATIEDREALARSLRAVVEGAEKMFRLEIPTGNERALWVEISGIAMRGATGDAMLHVVDVTERRRHESALREQARRDALTGLYNRQAFNELLGARLASNPSGTLLFIDLDDFKKVNDTHGHARGDEVLVAVANALRDAAGEDGIAARLGGDEYAVLVVSDAPGKDALGVMVSRRINVAATVAAGGAPVTASIGIVGLCAGASVESLLEDADRAMYAAKRSGKARCVEAHATVRRVS
jgi:diguanylate cyclase (GGDEF)-like protein/PAS domain S-box-containing protein